ncbi:MULTISPECIES: hypothetical protein [Deferrisoma]
MSCCHHELPSAEWLEAEARLGPDQETAEEEAAVLATKAARKEKEAQVLDVLSALKLKAADLEAQARTEVASVDALCAEAEERLGPSGEPDESPLMREIAVASSLVEAETVVGPGPGNYHDFNPYHGWWAWYRHNEGGVTQGSGGFSLAARKMYAYANARGDGWGITDDNYVNTYVKLFFALWPRRNGHVRAWVPYTTRGWYTIYANDHWYDSKSAKLDVDVSVRLHQNYWSASVRSDVFALGGGNINRSGRIDRSGAIYSASLPVGAERWVLAEVQLRVYAYTSGGGSTSRVSFRHPDAVFVPYVRFDFS